MGRGDLDRPGAEAHIHVAVGDHRDPAVHEGEDDGLAHRRPIPFVRGINRHGRVAEHGLGPGRGHLDVAAPVLIRIAEVPEAAGMFLVLDLHVGDGRPALGAPVDEVAAPVDQALFVEPQEDLPHRRGAALVHREALALPVAGASEPLELLDDGAAVLFLPGPDPLEEAFAAQFLLAPALPGQFPLDHGLRGDARVVRARQPERLEPLHPAPPDQDVLDGHVEGVPEMQGPGHVRRRDHDAEWLPLRIDLGVKIAPLHPPFVPAILNHLRVVDRLQFLSHLDCPPSLIMSS